MKITHCRICHDPLFGLEESHGVCAGCRNAEIRKAVKLGYFDWRHIPTHVIMAIAERAKFLLNHSEVFSDASWHWHDAESLDGTRYQHPTFYATVKMGNAEIRVTVREDQLLKILLG